MRQSDAGALAVDVAIIGAGPAGLTAGYLLAKAGKSVAIIEKDPEHVGGLGRTVERDGERFDIGGHQFLANDPAVAALWEELLPGGFVERPSKSRIYHEGKLYSWPPRPFEVLRNLGLRRSAACLASYIRYRLLPLREVRTFEDWASNRFGRELCAVLFKGYAEKMWGLPCGERSAGWAEEGMSRDAAEASIRHPAPGQGTLWEAARDRIVERGGRVLMGHALDQLAADGDGGWRLSASGPEGQVVMRARHAISSAALRELAARLHPLPRTTWNASKLKYRDLLTVVLKIHSAGPFCDNRVYVHDGGIQAGRVHGIRAWPVERAPREGADCLGLEYFCFDGDALWSQADEDLVALATSEVAKLGLVSPDKVIGGIVVRQEKAYPVCDDGYAANVAALHDELAAKYPTLHLVGRNGLHRDIGQDQATMTAILAAETILARSGEAHADGAGAVAAAAGGGHRRAA